MSACTAPTVIRTVQPEPSLPPAATSCQRSDRDQPNRPASERRYSQRQPWQPPKCRPTSTFCFASDARPGRMYPATSAENHRHRTSLRNRTMPPEWEVLEATSVGCGNHLRRPRGRL